MAKVQVAQPSVPEGWIDLGIGQPHVDILPLEQMAQAAEHRFKKGDRNILQYGMQQGSTHFRTTLSQFLSRKYSLAVEPDHLFITAGISQALDQICSLYTKPGDTIIVEEPSYFLALRIFADHKLKVIGTPIDEKGLIIEALEERLDKHRPIFVYSIPTFHNPAGFTLSGDRREKLVRLSEKYDFLIVADEVYQLLAYTDRPPSPMVYYDTAKRVLSLGSFSKILAPGLRLGWIHADHSLLQPFILCGVIDSGGGLNPFVSSIVQSVIELGLQEEYLNFLKTTYRDRMVSMCGALREQVPDLTFTDPKGGYFIWSYLSDGTNAEDMLEKAKKYRVRFQPGIKFSSMDGLRNYLRLSFSFYGIEDLLEGVERLSRVFI